MEKNERRALKGGGGELVRCVFVGDGVDTRGLGFRVSNSRK